jgi:hypothetical protein
MKTKANKAPQSCNIVDTAHQVPYSAVSSVTEAGVETHRPITGGEIYDILRLGKYLHDGLMQVGLIEFGSTKMMAKTVSVRMQEWMHTAAHVDSTTSGIVSKFRPRLYSLLQRLTEGTRGAADGTMFDFDEVRDLVQELDAHIYQCAIGPVKRAFLANGSNNKKNHDDPALIDALDQMDAFKGPYDNGYQTCPQNIFNDMELTANCKTLKDQIDGCRDIVKLRAAHEVCRAAIDIVHASRESRIKKTQDTLIRHLLNLKKETAQYDVDMHYLWVCHIISPLEDGFEKSVKKVTELAL